MFHTRGEWPGTSILGVSANEHLVWLRLPMPIVLDPPMGLRCTNEREEERGCPLTSSDTNLATPAA